jgi:hypothetical protein
MRIYDAVCYKFNVPPKNKIEKYMKINIFIVFVTLYVTARSIQNVKHANCIPI